MKKKRIVIPIPNHDFDPTELSVPWLIAHNAGHDIEFATIDGDRGYADPIMVTGKGLDPWGWVPGINNLKLMGLSLRADRFGRAAYKRVQQDHNFLHPKRFEEVSALDYDGIILPGGHAPGMKSYLENKLLQRIVVDFFETFDRFGQHKPVAAICHGVLLAARSISSRTGKSVLFGKRTTALTWALERTAWMITKYYSRFWDSNYYRTYVESPEEPPGYWSVENEVKRALAKESDFIDVPKEAQYHFLKTSGMFRDRLENSKPSWVIRDGKYVSARWPGDAHAFAKEFVALLE